MATTIQGLSTDAGASLFKETALTNAALTVKATGATVYIIDIDNTAVAAITYVKLYHSAGAITVGTTVPDDVIMIPASTRTAIVYSAPKAVANGLQVCAVTAGGTAGVGAPAGAVIARIVFA